VLGVHDGGPVIDLEGDLPFARRVISLARRQAAITELMVAGAVQSSPAGLVTAASSAH
jgi:hypothetical protein